MQVGKLIQKRSLITFVTLFILVVMAGIVSAEQLVILHTNDVHARLESFPAPDSDEEIGGLVRLASLVRSIREQYPGQTLLVDGGDAIHGTNIANVFGGESVVEVKNAMGYRISTVGNHEFNYGQEILKQRIADYNHPVLASNVIDTSTYEPLGYTDVILTVDGVKVGVFGLVSPETPIVTHPKNVQGLKFLDPFEQAEKIVAHLRDRVDIIVACNHIGLELDKELAQRVPGIDVIISAHSHDQLDEPIIVGDTIIASAGEHSKYLGFLRLDITDGKIVTFDGGLLPITSEIPEDPKISEIIAKWNEKLNDKLEQVIGKTTVLLDGERNNVRSRETNLGNMVADAMRVYAGTDIALTNGGGIRASINAGDITMGDVYTVLPFDNTLITLQVTGAQLKEALEHSVSAYPETLGGFLQVSGISFEFDPGQPVGERVTKIMVGNQPYNPKAAYTVATNDFLAAGGDGYSMLAAARKLADTGMMLRDIIAEFFSGQTINPKIEGRIVVRQ